MRIPALLVWLAAVAWTPAFAQTETESERIAWTLERGRLLFEIDRAAWVGTDDMLERMPDPANSGMRGYIVERDGPGFAVTFYGAPPAAPLAFYRGIVRDGRVVSREIFPADARPPLTGVQARLAAARDMAAGLGRRPCVDRPFNTAVIPPDTPAGPVDLYLLTPQVRNDEFPLGGHFRFTIAADGTVEASRPFTNACLNMRVPPGERTQALFVTHLLDPVPTEIHVFSAMTSGFAIGVATGADSLWWVTGDEIRLVDEMQLSPGT